MLPFRERWSAPGLTHDLPVMRSQAFRYGGFVTPAEYGTSLVLVILAAATAFFLCLALDVLWQYGKALYCRTKLRRIIKSHQRRDAECDHEAAVSRQRWLLKLADDIAALPESDQQRLQRLAEARGFLDPSDGPWAA